MREGLIRYAHPTGVMVASVPDVQMLAHLSNLGSRVLTHLSTGFGRKKSPHLHASSSLNMAVREGFEPSIRCRIHTFQACSFSHSDTSPFCCSLTSGTGANVGERAACVNSLLNKSGAFSQTSSNLLLKTALHADFLLHSSHVLFRAARKPKNKWRKHGHYFSSPNI